MDAIDLIKAGKLTEARAQLVEHLKKAPADTSARALLFQVLVFFGEWDKARRHMEIIATQNPQQDMRAVIYEHLFQAEKERSRVARGESRPTFLPEVPEYSETYFAAMALLAGNQPDEARIKFEQVLGARPSIRGTLNGEPFEGFQDTDTTLWCFIEAIEYERYIWIPVEFIRELVITPPQSLLDLVWAKGRITTWAGLTMGCFFPALYPNSFNVDDDRIRLGRLTDWHPLGGGFSRAVGQHVFQVGQKDVSIFELGETLFTLSDNGNERQPA
jgi:type VI secretion system protein ImpE